jgi:hypothetical protein
MMKLRTIQLAEQARKRETRKAYRILTDTSLRKCPNWNKETEVKG